MYAKLNPGVKYVQGMNELLAPIYYVMVKGSEEGENRKHAEADSFFCFMNLMSEVRDLFMTQMDADSGGVCVYEGRVRMCVWRLSCMWGVRVFVYIFDSCMCECWVVWGGVQHRVTVSSLLHSTGMDRYALMTQCFAQQIRNYGIIYHRLACARNFVRFIQAMSTPHRIYVATTDSTFSPCRRRISLGDNIGHA